MTDTRKLPTLPTADVASHNTEESCYVTIGNKVYDVTEFVNDHPGGGELVLEWAGKDITKILQDELSHAHTDAAYEILDDYHVGYVATEPLMQAVEQSNHPANIVPLPPNKKGLAELQQTTLPNGKPVFESTGMSTAEDLSVETNASTDYKTHKFLDLNRPLLMQVWNGGFSRKFYLEQVHRPRHYKGGASAPLFGNFLEPLSLTPWWVVPMIWLPPVMYGTVLAAQNMGSYPRTAAYWVLGLCLWTLVEYVLHRFLFHIENYLPDNRVGITLHFLLHGVHHYLPMDKLRLVMPPTLFLVLATPFWHLVHSVISWDWYAATALFCGGILGYICYDLTHYFLHHRTLPSYYRELKKYHLQHHFADYDNGFGVTSRFWDRIFGTELEMPQIAKAA